MYTLYFETHSGNRYGFMGNGNPEPELAKATRMIERHDHITMRGYCPFIFDEDDAKRYFDAYKFPFENVKRIDR